MPQSRPLQGAFSHLTLFHPQPPTYILGPTLPSDCPCSLGTSWATMTHGVSSQALPLCSDSPSCCLLSISSYLLFQSLSVWTAAHQCKQPLLKAGEWGGVVSCAAAGWQGHSLGLAQAGQDQVDLSIYPLIPPIFRDPIQAGVVIALPCLLIGRVHGGELAPTSSGPVASLIPAQPGSDCCRLTGNTPKHTGPPSPTPGHLLLPFPKY